MGAQREAELVSVAGKAALQAGWPGLGSRYGGGAGALGQEKSLRLWKSCCAPFNGESEWYKSMRKGKFSLKIVCFNEMF